MNLLVNGNVISYENDPQHSYMVLKPQQFEEIIEYQIRMIQENPAKQLLPILKKQVDQDLYLYYDITSKITLEQFLKMRKISKHEFLSILKSLLKGLNLGKLYLLRDGSYLLDSNYIYIDPENLELSIAYLPVEAKADVSDAVRELVMDLLVYKVSFSTAAEGDFVYGLLNLLKGEGFNLSLLDKMINDLAVNPVQQDNSFRFDSKLEGQGEEEDGRLVVIKASSDASQVNAAASDKANMLFLLIQMLFAAAAVILFRALAQQPSGVDITSAIGVLLIVAAADFLIVKKLKLKPRALEAFKRGLNSLNASDIEHKEKGKKGTVEQNHAGAYSQHGNATMKHKQALKHQNSYGPETKILTEEEKEYAYLLGVGNNLHEKVYINKSSFIIGRIKGQADFISENHTVGKLHAEIINKAGKYYLKDLNSRNGTYINGERIVSNVEYSIQNNDRISFANSEYRFHWC